MDKLVVEFADAREIEAGTIAVREFKALVKESAHGEIVLAIRDGRVVESHRKVSKRYGERCSQ